MNKIKPASPSDITSIKIGLIPKELIELINSMLASAAVKNHSNKFECTIYQDEIVETFTAILNRNESVTFGGTVPALFNMEWLNFESLYEEQGWKVTYEKPAYNESGRPFFTFEEK